MESSVRRTGRASTWATSTPWAIARQKRWPVGCWPPVRARHVRDLGLAVVRWDPAEITSDSYAVACRFRETRRTHDPRSVRARIRYDGSNTTTVYTPGR